MIYRNLKIGNTDLIKISKNIYAKCETQNPTGSVKDRIIAFILKEAERNREIVPGKTTLVEATSGNTGIALAAIGAHAGYKVRIIMPCNMSDERKKLIKTFGASLTLVSESNFAEAIEVRNSYCKSPDFWSPNQFENKLNILCHKRYLAHEIGDQCRRLGIIWDAFVCGAGTGGTMMGVSSYLNNQKINFCKKVLMTPYECNKTHGIQGVNDGADFLLERDEVDHIIKIKTSDAIERSKKFASEFGMLVGISSGANLLAAEEYMRKFQPNHAVVTLLCDRGERYMSIY